MLEIELVIRLLVSVLLGIVVGIEREMSHKPAGLRTHALVSLGACLFTIASVYYFNLDPARIASGIVAGIGFIGAGAIIGSREHIQGITTAATLWVVAGIGLGVGIGAYVLSAVSTILVFLILQMKKAEKQLRKRIMTIITI